MKEMGHFLRRSTFLLFHSRKQNEWQIYVQIGLVSVEKIEKTLECKLFQTRERTFKITNLSRENFLFEK